MHTERLIAEGSVRLNVLRGLADPPQPWERGEPLFWDDPHIATQMLAVHLDPNTSAASAPPEVVDKRVDWIIRRLDLGRGDSLIDLGCGPGLYARRFATAGLHVTGVDLSENSINYARSQDPVSTYRCENYLKLADTDAYDAAALISGDYCVLTDTERSTLLANIHRALKPGGWLVLDVTTQIHHVRYNCGDGWSVHPEGGFWKAGPYLALMRHYTYPDLDLAVDQYVVIEASGTLTVYRNWFRYFDAATIAAELETFGFTVRDLHGDLAGAPLDPDAGWIGVVAQRQ